MNQPAVTELLDQLREGNTNVVDEIFPLVYDHLRLEAHYQLRHERKDHTFHTTALVHEAYLKMVGQSEADYKNRSHFLAIAALAMRRILISYARKQKAEKRGGNEQSLTFTDGMAPFEADLSKMIDLDNALEELKALDKRQSEIVQYRFFGGLSYKEIAEVVGGTEHSVRYDWRVARAWLKRKMGS